MVRVNDSTFSRDWTAHPSDVDPRAHHYGAPEMAARLMAARKRHAEVEAIRSVRAEIREIEKELPGTVAARKRVAGESAKLTRKASPVQIAALG